MYRRRRLRIRRRRTTLRGKLIRLRRRRRSISGGLGGTMITI